jgi:glycosyltransferase involved in cell wall biosynthesis
MNILIPTFSFPSIKRTHHDGKFVFSEAVAYAENGANVRVITPHYPGVDKTERIKEKIKVLRFQYFVPKSLQVLKKPGVPIYNQKSFLAIAQIPLLGVFFALQILKHSPWADIIHAQWTITALLSLPAKWLLGKKVVLTARGSDLRLFPGWLNRFIHSRVDAAIDCFGPQPWNDEYKRNFPARYIKLPHITHHEAPDAMPQDMRKIVYQKLDAFIILYVGRFDYIKINVNKLPLINLIHSARIMHEKSLSFHVFYIGDGDERITAKISGLINEYNLHHYVTLLGVKVNVPHYVGFSHVGVGGIAFNAVSQEFTICGRPQILVKGLDNEGTPWRHGVNSIFVEPNDPMDLAEKLTWAMSNRERLTEMGENAKDDMKPYIIDSRSGGRLYLREFQKLIN